MNSLETLIPEVRQEFDDLYNSINERKKRLFHERISQLNTERVRAVGDMGELEEILFIETQVRSIKKKLFEDPCSTNSVERFNEETFWDTEFKDNNSLQCLIKIKRINRSNETKDDFTTSIAEKYLAPHILDYLAYRISHLKKEIGIESSFMIERQVVINKIPEGNEARISNKKTNKINQVTNFKWIKEGINIDSNKREKVLKQLHNSLETYHFIEKIPFSTFRKHFSGTTQDTLINWTTKQYQLIYLLNRLQPFMYSKLYNKDKTRPSATIISKHFLFNGKTININSLNVIMHNSESYFDKVIQDRIDLIIKQLKTI